MHNVETTEEIVACFLSAHGWGPGRLWITCGRPGDASMERGNTEGEANRVACSPINANDERRETLLLNVEDSQLTKSEKNVFVIAVLPRQGMKVIPRKAIINPESGNYII